MKFPTLSDAKKKKNNHKKYRIRNGNRRENKKKWNVARKLNIKIGATQSQALNHNAKNPNVCKCARVWKR